MPNLTITTVEAANAIDMIWVARNVDFTVAERNYSRQPSSNSQRPHEFTMLPLGTWQKDPYGEMSVLVEIKVEDMKPSEGDWDVALTWPSTKLYIEWQKQGMEPPPLDVVDNNKGRLVSNNRRRWLAAREAGVETLKCWYSPTHPEHCASPKFDTRWLC